MTPPAISTEAVHVTFDGVQALQGVSLDVPIGQRRALIGPNGAGKTTFFNAVDGTVQPKAGTIRLFGDDVTGWPTHRRARHGLARTFQVTNLLPGLDVWTNMKLGVAGAQPSVRRRFLRPLESFSVVMDRSEMLLRQWDLWPYRQHLVGELAYGQQRVLEIALALSSAPRILLLDEPTAGLSKADANVLADVASDLPRDLTLLVIEHDMDVAFQLAELVTVLAQGAILAQGTPDEIRSNKVVIETYLGVIDGAA